MMALRANTLPAGAFKPHPLGNTAYSLIVPGST